MEQKDNKQVVNIDGKEYDLEQMSDKAKNMIGFLQRIDKEMLEMRYQLDKASMARRQTLIELKGELEPEQ